MKTLKKDYWQGWIDCYIREYSEKSYYFEKFIDHVEYVFRDEKLIVHYPIEYLGTEESVLCIDPIHKEYIDRFNFDTKEIPYEGNDSRFAFHLEEVLLEVLSVNPFGDEDHF